MEQLKELQECGPRAALIRASGCFSSASQVDELEKMVEVEWGVKTSGKSSPVHRDGFVTMRRELVFTASC